MSDLDRAVVRSSAWLAVGYGGSQLLSLVVTATLAHLLAPAAFGAVALASIALVVLGILQESGLAVATIQRRTDVEEAVASTFVFSTILGVLLFTVAWVAAPLAAHVFGAPQLTEVLRLLAILLVLRGPATATGAVIERQLQFGRRAVGELSGIVAQGTVSIAVAALGGGVWSLVAGQLAGQSVQTAAFWLAAPIRPDPRRASWRMVRELGRFGRHVTAANLVALVDGNADTVTVGRVLGASAVGSYNLAWRLSNLPATGLSYIIGRAMLPAYSSVAGDLEAFREAFLTTVRRVGLLSLPVSLGILLAARPIVLVLFGERWHAAVAPLQVLAVFGLIRSFSASTGSVFQAAGRPQLAFWISTYHLGVLVAALALLTGPLGLVGVAAAMTIAAFASLLPSYWFALRILDLSLERLARELARPALCALPVAASLGAAAMATANLGVVAQLGVLAGCGTAASVAALATIGRSELRLIRAALAR